MEKEEKKVEEKEEESKQRYNLVEVPTQTEIVGKDEETGNLYNEKGLLVEILNKLNKIEKIIG